MTDVEFLDSDTVLYLHDAAIAAHGGSVGLNDANMLESALARPRNRHAYAETGELDLFDLAAAYAFGLVKNHAFRDGNKRTGWVAAIVFRSQNGTEVDVCDQDAIDAVIQLATDVLSENGFAAWLRSHQQAAPPPNATPCVEARLRVA